jgi:RNA 2',3'-cyclic 3'-phosphodiesterase
MRLFVAVWPPAPVLTRLDGLARPDIAEVRWTTTDQWHVTLRFLGEMASPEPVLEALAGVDLPPATARLAGPPLRLGRGMLTLPVSGLDALAAAVLRATVEMGRPPENRPFRGHVTLARSWRGSTEVWSPPSQLLETWEVRSVAIVRSHLGRTGARYETIAAVPVGEGKGSSDSRG